MTARRPTQHTNATTTPAARPATRTRSTTKSARGTAKPNRSGAGNRYTDEQRAEALKLVEGHGTAHAHKVTGVPKPTLSRWAKAAGLDTEEAARRRTASATEHTRARAAEVTATTVELLEAHVAQAGDYLATIAGVNALAARTIAALPPDRLERKVGIAGPYVVVNDATAEELGNVALAIGALPLATRDAEGILTRAIHDLQLLRGEATERGELVVEFAVPRPRPSDVAVVEYPTPTE